MWRGQCVFFFKLQIFLDVHLPNNFLCDFFRDADVAKIHFKLTSFGVFLTSFKVEKSSIFAFQENVAIDRVKLLKKLGPKKLEGKSAGFFFVSLHAFLGCFNMTCQKWGEGFGFSCFFFELKFWTGRKQHK